MNDLPIEYRAVEYIEFNGGSQPDKQYIDVPGIYWDNIDVEYKLKAVTKTLWSSFFGCSSGYGKTSAYAYTIIDVFAYNNNKYGYHYGNSLQSLTNFSLDNAVTYRLVRNVDEKLQRYYFDNTLVNSTFSNSTPSNDLLLKIGAISYHSTQYDYTAGGSSHLVYEVKTREYGTDNITHHFIPVRKKVNNEYGFYDLITETFFGKTGGPDLTGGPDIIIPYCQDKDGNLLGNIITNELLLPILNANDILKYGDYNVLEYLKINSSDSETCYVDLGSISMTRTNRNHYIKFSGPLGYRNYSRGPYWGFSNSSSMYTFNYNSDNWWHNSSSNRPAWNSVLEIKQEQGSGTMQIYDVTHNKNYSASFVWRDTNVTNFRINWFNINSTARTSNGSYFYQMRFYSKSGDVETDTHNYLPVENKNSGELGVLEVVSMTFFPLSGTDTTLAEKGPYAGGYKYNWVDLRPLIINDLSTLDNNNKSCYDYLKVFMGSIPKLMFTETMKNNILALSQEDNYSKCYWTSSLDSIKQVVENRNYGKFIGLPIEYQEVEYLQSSGSQYIDTGFGTFSKSKLKIEYKIQRTGGSSSNWRQILGTFARATDEDLISLGFPSSPVAGSRTFRAYGSGTTGIYANNIAKETTDIITGSLYIENNQYVIEANNVKSSGGEFTETNYSNNNIYIYACIMVQKHKIIILEGYIH